MTTTLSEYKVDRYRNGNKMAEGAKVKAKSALDALQKAKRLFGAEDQRGITYEISEDFL